MVSVLKTPVPSGESLESRREPKIIGGMFGLPDVLEPRECFPPFLKEHNLLLANARSALFVLLSRLSPETLWLPSFLCEALLKPAHLASTNVRFYAIDERLRSDPMDLWNVKSGDLVLLIDYFGFRPCLKDLGFLRERGAWIVEDACQALLTEGAGEGADFVLYSPRKFLGVPDGGILTSETPLPMDTMPLDPAPAEWWLPAFSAAAERREFDRNGGERRWFGLFQQAEADSPVGPYAMSELSLRLLTHGFDYRAIAEQRVQNYSFLAGELGDFALFPVQPAGVVPLGFPVKLKGRDRVRQALFEDAIYPPVHWPVECFVPQEFEASHALAAEIMTLPCDQRYDSADMARMAKSFRKAVAA